MDKTIKEWCSKCKIPLMQGSLMASNNKLTKRDIKWMKPIPKVAKRSTISSLAHDYPILMAQDCFRIEVGANWILSSKFRGGWTSSSPNMCLFPIRAKRRNQTVIWMPLPNHSRRIKCRSTTHKFKALDCNNHPWHPVITHIMANWIWMPNTNPWIETNALKTQTPTINQE